MVTLFWFRRDLRLFDNAGLYHALKSGYPVIPLFIFDLNVLNWLEDKDDPRVEFVYNALLDIQAELSEIDSSLEIHIGYPVEVFKKLIVKYKIAKVFVNVDYAPDSIKRDQEVSSLLLENGISFHSYKDQVIFDQNDVLSDKKRPYITFTHYCNKWKRQSNNFYFSSYLSEKYLLNFLRPFRTDIPSFESLHFKRRNRTFPPKKVSDEFLLEYDQRKDFPADNGTSQLGVHLRFGTISIRELVQRARALSLTYLEELIWREFYHMILWHFPKVGGGEEFRPVYDGFHWRNDENDFERWCNGNTGIPIVDAGMRELMTTGFMHNRVRMITACYLVKDLLIDWRWGEAWFASKLLDYDLASNNGGWQWAAGCGCDPVPYFRIFNPILQAQKFDKDQAYIRKWIPELDTPDYPLPIIDHSTAKKRFLKMMLVI